MPTRTPKSRWYTLGSNIIMIDEVISTLSIVIGVRVLWNMRAASNVMMDV